jgi:hypothetical protein
MGSLLRRMLKQRRGFPDITGLQYVVSVNSESLLAQRRDSFIGLPAPKYLVEIRCSEVSATDYRYAVTMDSLNRKADIDSTSTRPSPPNRSRLRRAKRYHVNETAPPRGRQQQARP